MPPNADAATRSCSDCLLTACPTRPHRVAQDAGMLAAKQAAAARAGAVAAAAAEIPAEAPSPEQLEWLREEQARLKEEYAK